MGNKLSVIIPVYNTGKYLNRCIDSILGQDDSGFEIILIDDGSTDNSPIICDDYAENDDRVRVIHKTNGGVSTARNCGIANATGEYVWFVDSDDFVERNSLATITQAIKDGSSDIYEFSFFRNGRRVPLYDSPFTLNTPEEVMRSFLSFPKFHLWSKVIKRSTIGEYRFLTDCSIGEDFLFLTYVYNNAKSYSYVDSPIYQYFDGREGSAMTTITEAKKAQSLNMVFGHILENKDIFTPQNFAAIPTLFLNRQNAFLLSGENGDNHYATTIREIRFSDVIGSNCSIKRKLILLAAKIITGLHV